MILIQFTGLSGAGKTTLALHLKEKLERDNFSVEIIDGDVYRKTVCKDLGFSRNDRMENIRRLGKIAHSYTSGIVLISAINPYQEVRKELETKYKAKTIWIKCDLELLIQRDTKGLYKKALLPDVHPGKIFNLTGVNDVYEVPENAHLIIDTSTESIQQSVQQLYLFISNALELAID